MGDRGGRNGSEIAPRRNDGHGGRISEGAGRANAGPASGNGVLRAAGQVQPGRDHRGGGVPCACAARDRDLRVPAGEPNRNGHDHGPDATDADREAVVEGLPGGLCAGRGGSVQRQHRARREGRSPDLHRVVRRAGARGAAGQSRHDRRLRGRDGGHARAGHGPPLRREHRGGAPGDRLAQRG